MRTAILALWIALAVPAGASVVSTAVVSDLPLTSGSSGCSQSGIGPVSCGITFFVGDPSTHQASGGSVNVTADFGLATGLASFGTQNAAVDVTYLASFGDQVTVFGGTGAGVLVTHYQLLSVDNDRQGAGLGFPPSYRFVQGATIIDYTPNLPPPLNAEPSVLIESKDVTSSFVFGVPFLLSADTHAELVTPSIGSFIPTTQSSLELTGFTVLDATGAVLPGATVQQSVPEPGTIWCGLVCLALPLLRKFRPGRSL